MASSEILYGPELIDCARANNKEGIAVAAQRSGYGDDLAKFEQELKKAGEGIGVEIQSFDDLSDTPHANSTDAGLIIAPDSASQL